MAINVAGASPALNILNENFSDTLLRSDENYVRSYESASEEYMALYKGAGIIDMSHCGVIELKGSEIYDFLNRISTNLLKNLNLFESARTVFTTEKGRILDLADVLHLEDKTLLFCSAAHYNKLLIWLNRYIIMEEIKVEGAAEKYLTLDFIGSQSVSFLSLISGLRAEEIDSALTHKTSIEGTEVLIARLTELNGVKKYRLIAKAEESENIIGHILAGKSAFDVRFIGSDAYETFRVENRIPKAPEELNDTYNPHEARLLDYVSFIKGCYIGQEVIARLDTYNKVQKQLVKLELNGADDPKAQDIILDESGAEAGVITSVAPQGVIEKRIALAYVKIGLLESGEEFRVKGNGQTYTAKNLNTPEDK